MKTKEVDDGHFFLSTALALSLTKYMVMGARISSPISHVLFVKINFIEWS